MIDPTALAAQAMIETERLRLEPLGPEHFGGVWRALTDPEVRHLTGTRHTFSEEAVRRHLELIATRIDWADWAVIVYASNPRAQRVYEGGLRSRGRAAGCPVVGWNLAGQRRHVDPRDGPTPLARTCVMIGAVRYRC